VEHILVDPAGGQHVLLRGTGLVLQLAITGADIVQEPVRLSIAIGGASLLEREDDIPMTVKSALDLLGSAYALHPAFGEASILDMGAGIRPAFPDNIPRAIIEDGGKTIRVNGTYRHGFLLAPALAKAVSGFLSDGRRDSPLFDSPGA